MNLGPVLRMAFAAALIVGVAADSRAALVAILVLQTIAHELEAAAWRHFVQEAHAAEIRALALRREVIGAE